MKNKKTKMQILNLIVFGGLLAFILMAFSSCDNSTQSHGRAYVVNAYKQKTPPNDSNFADDWVFWYIIWNNNNSSAYYYSSPTPITNFATVNFSYTDNVAPLQQMELTVEEPIILSETELNSTTNSEIDANADEFSDVITDNESSSESSYRNSGFDSGSAGGGD